MKSDKFTYLKYQIFLLGVLFLYMQLLQLVLDGKLANLSGTAQKHIFHILEATVNEGKIKTIIKYNENL